MYLNYTLFLKNIKYIDMKQSKDQIEILKSKLQKIKDISYGSIQRDEPNPDWAMVNNLAHECKNILEYKIKTP
tara:strand:- start:342 stop:560 length:219 start_codon:yes stop_codon:yes gene_type:complete